MPRWGDMGRMRRLTVPLPFADIAITFRANRRARPMLWYVIASALFHVLFMSVAIALLARTIFPALQQQQRPPQELVAISSAVRIEHRARPVTARTPVARPHSMTVARKAAAAPRRSSAIVRQAHDDTRRRAVAKIAFNAPHAAPSPALTQAQLQAQTRSFEAAIAHARAQNDPVAGAAREKLKPTASKRYALNIEGDTGPLVAEGILYPLNHWTQGDRVYYYVRYTVQYADGATETGIVPWPISFPIAADPFARSGGQRMPLPGPPSDYFAASDVVMHPLVKNCYDHRYAYCPIERE
jgi:hypothetical protein